MNHTKAKQKKDTFEWVIQQNKGDGNYVMSKVIPLIASGYTVKISPEDCYINGNPEKGFRVTLTKADRTHESEPYARLADSISEVFFSMLGVSDE